MLEDMDWIDQMARKYSLIPYWIDVPPPEQEFRMKEFERAIFTTWAGLEKRMREGGASSVEILHAQDWAVFEGGQRPARIGSSEKFEKKKKIGAQFEEVMRD